MEEFYSIESPCNVMVVDPWAVIRMGVKQILDAQNDPICLFRVATAPDASEALRRMEKGPFDIALLSDKAQIGGVPLLIAEMLKRWPDLRIMVMGDLPLSQHVKQAVEAGASGYIHKNVTPQELVQAVSHTFNGRTYYSASVANRLIEDERMEYQIRTRTPTKLTPRELQVLRLIAAGKTTGEICRELSIGARTAETYRKHLLQKTRVGNAPALVRFAFTNKLLE